MDKTAKLGSGLLALDLSVVVTTTATCMLVFGLAFWASRKLTLVPTGMQNAMEGIIEFTQSIARMQMDAKTASRFYGFVFSLFTFIFFANQLGLVGNFVTTHHEAVPLLGIEASVEGDHHDKYSWWKSPTADVNVALAMAIAIAISAHCLGIRRSPKHYLLHYVKPYPVLAPLHVLNALITPLTHGLRLWANIFAGEVLIVVLLGGKFFTTLPLVVWLAYSLFVGTIQAYVFTALAMVYFSQQVMQEEDH